MINVKIPLGTIKILYPNNKIKVEECVSKHKISCSGADESSKHPKVYLAIKNNVCKCPYCGTIFRIQQ